MNSKRERIRRGAERPLETPLNHTLYSPITMSRLARDVRKRLMKKAHRLALAQKQKGRFFLARGVGAAGTRRLPAIGMSSKKKVRLRYVTEITLNASGVGLSAHYFSANGMFDPDVTGTGHQPLYYDQWMVNYEHYQVLGSKIKVTALPSQNAGSTPGVFGVVLDNNTSIQHFQTLN